MESEPKTSKACDEETKEMVRQIFNEIVKLKGFHCFRHGEE